MRNSIMFIKIIFLLLIIFNISFCSKGKEKSEEEVVNYRELLSKFIPSSLTVIKNSGITIRDRFNSKEGKILKDIPTAIKDYKFDIFNAKPLYYKIRYVGDKVGWISAGVEDGWTKVKDGKVKVLLEGGITVRDFPYKKKIGIAATSFSFEILDVLCSYYQIKLPNNKKGWIYAGKLTDRWVDDNKSFIEETEEIETEKIEAKNKEELKEEDLKDNEDDLNDEDLLIDNTQEGNQKEEN